jgi:hypothetical protein
MDGRDRTLQAVGTEFDFGWKKPERGTITHGAAFAGSRKRATTNETRLSVTLLAENQQVES